MLTLSHSLYWYTYPAALLPFTRYPLPNWLSGPVKSSQNNFFSLITIGVLLIMLLDNSIYSNQLVSTNLTPLVLWDIEDNISREADRQFEDILYSIQQVMDKIQLDSGGTVSHTISEIEHSLSDIAVPNVFISKMVETFKKELGLSQ
jgi:hypothetical protein